MTQQIDAVNKMITYTLVTDKNSLVRLLERNGVRLPSNPSDQEITVAVLASSAKSPNFKMELANLLTQKAVQVQDEYEGFAGDDTDFGFTGIDDFIGANGDKKAAKAARKKEKVALRGEKKKKRINETNPKGKTGFGNFLSRLADSTTSQDTINSGINIGLTALNNKVASKQNELQAQAAAITAQQDEARQAIAAQQGGKMNVFLIVGVVAVVGILAYFAFKKK